MSATVGIMGNWWSAILDELVWRGAIAEGERSAIAQSCAAPQDGVVVALMRAGVDEDEVMAAVAQISGVQAAPLRLIENPQRPLGQVPDVEGGIVVGDRDGVPCVAFVNPELAMKARDAQGTVPLLVKPANFAALSAWAASLVVEEQDSLSNGPPAVAPSRSADSAEGALGPEFDAGPQFDDDLDDGATVINDVAALEAMMRAERVTLKSDEPATQQRSLASAGESPVTADVHVDDTAQESAPLPPRAQKSMAIGIDPALLAAVVQEEVAELEASGRAHHASSKDIDPATLMTRPFTPEDEAMYGAMKTTALKLHVDRLIPLADDSADALSLLDASDVADVSDVSDVSDESAISLISDDVESLSASDISEGSDLSVASDKSDASVESLPRGETFSDAEYSDAPSASAAGPFIDDASDFDDAPTRAYAVPASEDGIFLDDGETDARPTEVLAAVMPAALALTVPAAAPTRASAGAMRVTSSDENLFDDDINSVADGFDDDSSDASTRLESALGKPGVNVGIANLNAAFRPTEEYEDAPTMVSVEASGDGTRPTPMGLPAMPIAQDVAAHRQGGTPPPKNTAQAIAEANAAWEATRHSDKSARKGSSSSAADSNSDFSSDGAKYEVKSVLGRGGMATVYLAKETGTGADVALKILESHLAQDETFVERFRREMRATEKLDHPNIIRCFDSGETDGNYFIAAEYVDRGTLSQLLRECGRIPIPLVVGIMEQALKGLDYAHASGTIHRDLKPANVMFNKEGVLKIADFGIAKTSTDETITQTGTLFGTPAYMSPEQSLGKDIDGRSDLFSIGVVFYQLITGENPFQFDNPSTSLFRISSGMYTPLFDMAPETPQLLDNIITRLLSKDREDRYARASHALDDLKPLIDLVRGRHPEIESRTLAEPERMVAMLREDESTLRVAHARVARLFDPPRLQEATFHVYAATRCLPDNYEATNALMQLRVDHGMRVDHDPDPRIEELELAMGLRTGERKTTPAQLRRAFDLHMTQKDVWGTAKYLRAYVRMMPHDAYMQARMKEILGADVLAPFSAPPQVSTSTRTDQSADVVPGLMAGGPIRQKADPLALPLAESRTPIQASIDELAAQASRPTPKKAKNAKAEAAKAEAARVEAEKAEAARLAALQQEEEDLSRPAKDSMEEIERILRIFWRETVRSFTGDRGYEGLREWWEDRFGKESREELKREAQKVLSTSKGALAEGKKKLVGEAVRESLAVRMKDGWTRHQRLIRVGVAVMVAWMLLSWGCSVACGFVGAEKPAMPRGRAAAPELPKENASSQKEKTPPSTQVKPTGEKKNEGLEVSPPAPSVAPGGPDVTTTAPKADVSPPAPPSKDIPPAPAPDDAPPKNRQPYVDEGW